MQIICLDFESYFDQDYSLSKLTTENYVRDKRFSTHGAAIKWSADTLPQWYDERALRWQLDQIDWSNTGVICHHAHFDGLILNHHFQKIPAQWFCTLSMARLLIGNHLPLGLDSLAKALGLEGKPASYLTKGKHWHEMNQWEQSALLEGAKHDVAVTWEIFGKLAREFPSEEYGVVDMTVRMFTEPKLLGDTELLGRIWRAENERKRELWAQIGSIDGAELRSNEKFAALLASRGVEVEYKEGKNGPIPAVAKNDRFMQELVDDDDEEISFLAQARINSKSSLIQTRAATLGNMAMRGALCVYLFYCGAHTTRWSGGDGANFQNLKRRNDIRKSLLAPDSYFLAVPDQSQIECRILNFLAGQNDVIERFRAGHDPYIGIASQFYGRSITKTDQPERGAGKQAELSCGYGCAGLKFQRTARLGIYGPPVILELEEATRFVQLYRSTHPHVVQYWRQAESIMPALASGRQGTWGPMTFRNGRIYLPNGAPLLYDTLEWHCNEETGETGWRKKSRNGWDKMYGAKLCEQTTQALARITCSQAMLRIRRAGFRIVGTSHDEAWILIPDNGHSKEAAEFCRQEMMRVPDWLPGIPLDAEIKVGHRYEK